MTLHFNKISTPTQLPTPATNDDNLNKRIVKNSSVFQGLGKLKDDIVKLNIDENILPAAEPQRRLPFHIK